jgi:hypothetical protein
MNLNTKPNNDKDGERLEARFDVSVYLYFDGFFYIYSQNEICKGENSRGGHNIIKNIRRFTIIHLCETLLTIHMVMAP